MAFGSWSNRANDLKITVTIINAELYDTKSDYQLIVSVIKCENIRDEKFNKRVHMPLIDTYLAKVQRSKSKYCSNYPCSVLSRRFLNFIYFIFVFVLSFID